MPKIGVSKPYVAKYAWSGSTVTYSDGQLIAKAAEFATTINPANDNNFYADNAVSESDTEFSNGSGTMTVDDLLSDPAKFIYGLEQTQYTPDDGEGSGQVQINQYNNAMGSPYCGLGVIIKIKNNNVTKWRGVILNKVQFTVPSESVQTQGQTINWQTTPIQFTILRDDTEKQGWMQDGVFGSENAALTWIKSVLTPVAEE